MDIAEGCRTARIGCVDCKKRLITNLLARLRPIREKRVELERDADRVREIMEAGNAAARSQAAQTMEEVRQAIGLGKGYGGQSEAAVTGM